jgi:hypothetical protein
MEFKVDNIADLDWDAIYPADDILIWQGQKWRFADVVGHFPDAGGPVIETMAEPRRYFCAHSMKELAYFAFPDDFLRSEKQGEIRFLLPRDWSEKDLEEWFEHYKSERESREQVRDQMLGSAG